MNKGVVIFPVIDWTIIDLACRHGLFGEQKTAGYGWSNCVCVIYRYQKNQNVNLSVTSKVSTINLPIIPKLSAFRTLFAVWLNLPMRLPLVVIAILQKNLSFWWSNGMAYKTTDKIHCAFGIIYVLGHRNKSWWLSYSACSIHNHTWIFVFGSNQVTSLTTEKRICISEKVPFISEMIITCCEHEQLYS